MALVTARHVALGVVVYSMWHYACYLRESITHYKSKWRSIFSDQPTFNH